MVKRLLKKAQSTAEYAILISLVIAAALGVQNEVRRALQARIHDAATGYLVRETAALGNTDQYEPGTGTKTTTNQRSDRVRVEDPTAVQDWTTINENSSADYGSTRVE